MYFGKRRAISSRRVFLLASDLFCIVGSIVLAAIVRLSPDLGWEYVLEHIPSLSGASLIFLVVFYAGGMYERQVLTAKGWPLKLPVLLVAVSLTIIIVIFYARFKLHIGRGILLLAGLFVTTSSWAVRRLLRVALGYGLFSKKTLIIGEGREAHDVVRLLSKAEHSGYRLYGVVSCTRTEKGSFLEGLPVLGHVSDLRQFVAAYDVETIIVATTLAREHTLLRIFRPLRYAGVEILDYVALYEELGQEIPLDHIDDEWLMNAAMNSSRIHIRQIKRIMDVAVAILGLVLLAPVTLVTAILVKMTSRGPVLYRQERTGLDSTRYTLLKFRTMVSDAEAESGAVWAQAKDHRVTRVGAFLRKWRIDEIPQLINVLRGEMSLVGPRPERPEFIEALAEAIPFYKERLLVPPGITGWAQVMYPYAASVEAVRRKLQYDLYYIKHMSFFLDAVILLRTFRTIIVGLRHSEDEEEQEGREEEKVFAEVISSEGADETRV
jgi:exopolysaccharide biosynthesis polyprenyl glycosylphosphotransferase